MDTLVALTWWVFLPGLWVWLRVARARERRRLGQRIGYYNPGTCEHPFS